MEKCHVTGVVLDPEGKALSKATVRFTMTTRDQDGSTVIMPSPVVAEIGADGQVAVDLWPNARGHAGTWYRVSVVAMAVGTIGMTRYPEWKVVVPEQETADLTAISELVPPPSVDDAEAARVAAQTAALEAKGYRDEAQTAATSTDADVIATAADRVATGQDRVATGEDRAAAEGAAGTATTQAGIATGAAGAASGSATAASGSASSASDDADATAADRIAVAADRAAAGDSADLAAAWAEGTLPGGAGTKSAKEHATDAAESAATAAAPDAGVSLFENLFIDPDFALGQDEYMTAYAGSTPLASLDTGMVFEGVFGPSLLWTGASVPSTYIGGLRIRSTGVPAMFAASGDYTWGFWIKASVAGTYRVLASSNIDVALQANVAKLVQIPVTRTSQNNITYGVMRNGGAFADGDKLWISPFVVYRGSARRLRNYASMTPNQVRDKFMASAYEKQVGRVVDLYRYHRLKVPAAVALAPYNDATVTYDTAEIFSGVAKCFNVSWLGTSVQLKAQAFFRSSEGYSVKEGETLNIAFRLLSPVDHTLRVDVFGNQNSIPLKAGKERLVVLSKTYTADSGPTDYLSVSIVNAEAKAGSFWMTQPIYFKGKDVPPWSIAPVHDWDIWGKTRFTDKKVAFLGDSMSVNRQWQPFLVDKYGFVWDSLETTNGTGGHRATAVGGTLVLPITGLGANSTDLSIYQRADDLIYYAPDVIMIFGGINDKGTLVPYGTIPVGSADDVSLPALTPWTSGSAPPAGVTFAAVYAGMIEKIINALPTAKIILFTMYPHQARNTSVTPATPRDVSADQLAQIKAMNEVIRGLAKRYSCTLVDLEWRGNFPVFNFKDDIWMSEDGTHLSVDGNLRMGECIAEALGQS